MSAVGAKWVVQRFEPSRIQVGYGKMDMLPAGYATVCKDWREACEAVTLAIGDNCLQFGVESKDPVVVFTRDEAVVVVYLEFRLDD